MKEKEEGERLRKEERKKRGKNKGERKEEETEGGQTCIFLYFDGFLILKWVMIMPHTQCYCKE